MFFRVYIIVEKIKLRINMIIKYEFIYWDVDNLLKFKELIFKMFILFF